MAYTPGLLPNEGLLPNDGLLPADPIGAYRMGRARAGALEHRRSTHAEEPILACGAFERVRVTGAVALRDQVLQS